MKTRMMKTVLNLIIGAIESAVANRACAVSS
jgi:hypothetical protein